MQLLSQVERLTSNFTKALVLGLLAKKLLMIRIFDLVILISYISASDVTIKWMLDHDFENNLDTSQLLWNQDSIPSLLTCGSLCNSNSSCRSFFYHPSLKICMGSQSYKRGLPSGQPVELGWKYYTKSQKCDGDYTFNKTLGLCFKIHPEAKPYQEAMTACEAEGAKLIIIRNEMELAQVGNALKAAGQLTYPLNGLRKTFTNGIETWKWWNGQIPPYVDWEPGEPNNAGGNENCGNFLTGIGAHYKFDDVNCFWQNSFVCQKNI
ncbi:hypothetical protein ACJMK2_001711 [Sinanodonta woodiana]|uniref:C-type lectin domain-containing protein n=1 Tax=Sinanodonta woodiana TaxID=1069815 RepID=A0ABD3XT13_SINWO